MVEPGDHLFAMVSRDDVWAIDGERRRHVESRASHGLARYRSSHPAEIQATDSLSALGSGADALRSGLQSLIEQAESAIGAIRTAHRVFARVVCSVRSVTAESGEDVRGGITIAVTIARGSRLLSAVTSPRDLQADLDLVESVPAADHRTVKLDEALPLLWAGGTAAVLFHEAIGHPAEHNHAPIRWPEWLHVTDDPTSDGLGSMHMDDAGSRATISDLTASDNAFGWRRESFRDAPLRRMTNLVVRHDRAPFRLPEHRVEIRMLAGGRYEPLSETVTLTVAVADRVTGESRTPLAPFELSASRHAIAAAILGASGEPIRYPGVICSTEGQEIVVGSFAPVILTAALQ